MASLGRILKESFPILLLTTVGGVAAGLLLDSMKDKFALIPGLLILLPAILGNRGNISGALGSRLASALHLGLIEPKLKLNKTLKDNVLAALILNIILSFILGIITYYAYILSGFQGQIPASIIDLTLISFIAGTLAGVILTVASVLLAILSYSKGLDPDNVLAPLLSTFGDIITVLCLLFAIWVII